jgi:UDP-2,3-diacylglucosamine pyrophosphatase LpxH
MVELFIGECGIDLGGIEMNKTVHTLVISDLHLGSPVSQKDKILEVLSGNFNTLIINGDLFDSTSFHRYKKKDWAILSKIRKLTKSHHVIFIHGNHDKDVEFIGGITGMDLKSNYTFSINGVTFYAEHGDQYDYWIKYKPFLTFVFTGLYYWVQKIDKSHKLTRKLKKVSKAWIQAKEIVAKKFLDKHGKRVDVCLAGHTHYPEMTYSNTHNCYYVNSGSFCDEKCTYIEIYKDGSFDLKEA